MTVEGDACADKDVYGSNNCDVQWGLYTVDDGDATKDIDVGSTFSADFTSTSLYLLNSRAPCAALTAPSLFRSSRKHTPSQCQPTPFTSQGLKGNITQALRHEPSPAENRISGSIH